MQQSVEWGMRAFKSLMPHIKERTKFEVGGPVENMSFFQIASGPILSIPIHSNTCLYDSCKV